MQQGVGKGEGAEYGGGGGGEEGKYEWLGEIHAR